jgi:hypothetical protein
MQPHEAVPDLHRRVGDGVLVLPRGFLQGMPHLHLRCQLVAQGGRVDVQAPLRAPCERDSREILVVAGYALGLVPHEAVVDEPRRGPLEQVDRPLGAVPDGNVIRHMAG